MTRPGRSSWRRRPIDRPAFARGVNEVLTLRPLWRLVCRMLGRRRPLRPVRGAGVFTPGQMRVPADAACRCDDEGAAR